MDFAKFVSLLVDEALHFATPDCMSDRFEGSVTKGTLDTWRRLGDMSDEAFESWNAQWSEINRRFRSYTYLNCWHMNEHESAAMWDIYQNGEPRGIAIRSTYRRLSESITDERSVNIGEIHYIDYATEIIPVRYRHFAYLFKRKSFEHEREIRALHLSNWAGQSEKGSDTSDWAAPGPPVIRISTDLDRLVDAVYVSPNAPIWFSTVVGSVLERYGRSWPVHQSNLDADPIF